jgi:phosphoribosylformimino-5-aminoimidazole carboxamide ribotide isomerase
MKIYPAIDLRGGNVVRLVRGDYDRMSVYGDKPGDTALWLRDMGARQLHVVDLDGALEGQAVNIEAVKAIVQSGLFVELGGGIRNRERIEQYLEAGVKRLILGTRAARDFSFVEETVAAYGDAIAVGVDASGGKVAIGGWKEITDTDSMEFCKKLEQAGVKTVIYTDISRDGELKGTNLPAYERLSSLSLNIIASGGISFESEIETLRDMGIYGAIVGKAIYEKKLDLRRVIEIAGDK